MQQPSRTLGLKINNVIFGLACMIFIIAARLFQLQVTQSNNFVELGKKNFLRVEKTVSLRGNIVDINGNLLATNRGVTDLYWQGSGSSKFDENQLLTLNTVEKILGQNILNDEDGIAALKHGERFYKQVLLATDITFEQLSQLEEHFPHNKNLNLVAHFKRFYPHNTLASHIIGYLGSFDLQTAGKMGLEKIFEEPLRGEQGVILKTINSIGRPLATTELKEALAGQDLRTTLDLSLQQLAEAAFPEEYLGAFVVMDPRDGSIMASVSRPTFDPSMFLSPIPAEQWSALQEKKPFINRVFNAGYPPASVFKVVSISAALETHIINPETTCYCRGWVRCGNRRYHCRRRTGHGEMTIEETMARSCNALFFEIGKRIKIDTLAQYARKFGLGEKTQTAFPEKEGLVPTSAWKLENLGEKWRAGETLSAIIGQSYYLVTPIQVACMFSAIFEDYLVTPRILTHEPIIKKPLALAPSTISFLRTALRSAVTYGSCVRFSRLKDMKIYGKTGTAQTSDLSKRELGKEFMEHGWVMVRFSYKNEQPLTLVILLENAGASEEAITVAYDFFIGYRKLMKERMQEA